MSNDQKPKITTTDAAAFLKNAPVVLNISSLSAGVNWPKMQQAIVETGLRIVGISGCKDEQLKLLIQAAGLPRLPLYAHAAEHGEPVLWLSPLPTAYGHVQRAAHPVHHTHYHRGLHGLRRGRPFSAD